MKNNTLIIGMIMLILNTSTTDLKSAQISSPLSTWETLGTYAQQGYQSVRSLFAATLPTIEQVSGAVQNHVEYLGGWQRITTGALAATSAYLVYNNYQTRKTKQIETNKLNDQIKILQGDKSRLENTLKDHEKVIEQYTATQKDQIEEIKNLTKKIDELNDQIKTLQDHKNRLENTLKDHEEVIGRYTETQKNQTEKIENLTKQIDELNDQIKTLQDHKSDLEDTLKDHKEVILEKTELIKNYEKLIEVNNKIIEQHKNDLIKKQDELIITKELAILHVRNNNSLVRAYP